MKKIRRNASAPKGGKRMDTPIVRVFGYGSLMNRKNVAERAPGARRVGWAKLVGYEAVFAKPGNTHVYLTIRRKRGKEIFGAVVDVDPPGLTMLSRSEPGYALVDVTDHVFEINGEKYSMDEPRVYAFIAPVATKIRGDLAYIRRSYITKCIADLPPEIRVCWLSDLVVIPKGVMVDEDK